MSAKYIPPKNYIVDFVKQYLVKPEAHGSQTQKVLPSHQVLFICEFISLLATFLRVTLFSAVTQYVSSANFKKW